MSEVLNGVKLINSTLISLSALYNMYNNGYRYVNIKSPNPKNSRWPHTKNPIQEKKMMKDYKE